MLLSLARSASEFRTRLFQTAVDPFTDRIVCRVTKISLGRVACVAFFTAILRKVVVKKVHAIIPKGNMGYDHYTVPNDCSCWTYFFCFRLALANICPWPSVPFFQISLYKSGVKTSHNTFRDRRVHFFRQPFSNTTWKKAQNCKNVNPHVPLSRACLSLDSS